MKTTLTKKQHHAIAHERRHDMLKYARFQSKHRLRLFYFRPMKFKRTLLEGLF